ncbi:MAG: hypothetical protein QXD98_01795 [Candidatus Diapherotrites archaeon]
MAIPTRNKKSSVIPKSIMPNTWHNTLIPTTKRQARENTGKYEPQKKIMPQQEIFELSKVEHERRIIEMIIKDFFPKNFKYVRRESLQGEQKELHDLRTLFLEAIMTGKIKKLEDFQNYLKKFLQENLEINEQQAQEIAIKSYKKFLNTLGPRRKIEELISYIKLMKN